ncbi:MAG: hypothetical protein HY577_00640 [Candidatus Nealsonbacteria bacterium]|nr:hypothetical protein [Candidatus Nealsonbacteria bacterium]
MTEKDLIKKISALQEIKPEKDWVVLTKRQILRDWQKPSLTEGVLEVFQVLPGLFRGYRPALATLAFLGLMVGSFGFSQLALPGDSFYPIKKMTERVGYLLVAKDQQPQASLEMANKRLDELTAIAQNNQARNLAPAINEFKASLGQAVNTLKVVNGSPKLTREIVKESEKLIENKSKIEALGVSVDEGQELSAALSRLVEREIKDLESRSLNSEQQKLLEQAKENYQKGNFSQALETILLLSYPQP